MYIEKGSVIRLGMNNIQTMKFLPELMVENKLSKKPEKAAKNLKKMVEGPNSICNNYDLSMEQDYSRGVVKLDLLGQCIIGNADGSIPKNTKHRQYIYQSSELPITAAVSRYTKAVREMINNTKNNTKQCLVETPTPRTKEKKWWQVWK